MHDIKILKKQIDHFSKKLMERNIVLDKKHLLNLDSKSRELIQKKEKLEQEKKVISQNKDKSKFERSKEISILIEELNKNLEQVVNSSNFSIDFNKCISDKQIEDYILEDRIEGVKKFKINSTPTLIINGESFENPLNYKKLKKYLEKLI